MIQFNFEGFKLILIDRERGEYGRIIYQYRFWDLKNSSYPLFEGVDFETPASHESCSWQAVRDLLSLISIGKEDLEVETYESYTAIQQWWLTKTDRLQELQQLSSDLEELAEIADSLYNLSRSDIIEWDEWKEDKDDDEGYLPVHLQYFKESYKLHWGEPSFIQDYQGYWGQSSITQDLTRDEAFSIVNDLREEALDASFM